MFMSPHTTVASGPASTWSRKAASQASLYPSCSESGIRPLGTYTDQTRIPPQVAATARASGVGKPGPPARRRTTASRPTREQMPTPFHCTSPCSATSYPRPPSSPPSSSVNAASPSLVSCRHTTSGRRWSNHRHHPPPPLLHRVPVPGRPPHADTVPAERRTCFGQEALRRAGRKDGDRVDRDEEVARQVDIRRGRTSRRRVRHVPRIDGIDGCEVTDVRVEDRGPDQGRQRRTGGREDRVEVAQRQLGLLLDTVRCDAGGRGDARRGRAEHKT